MTTEAAARRNGHTTDSTHIQREETFINKPFDQVGLQDVRAVVRPPSWWKTNRRFVEGDHWQDGAGWAGPMPREDDAGFATAFERIWRAFCSQNVILEVVKRHRAGVVGRVPHWTFTPTQPLPEPAAEETPEEKAEREAAETRLRERVREIEDLLTDWWDVRGVHDLFKRAVGAGQWGGRVGLRVFVPAGELVQASVEEGQPAPPPEVPRGTLEESLNRIHVELLLGDQANVAKSRLTMREIGVYLYREGNEERAEITYLDDQGNTVVRVLGAGGDVGALPMPLPLGGNLTLLKAEFEPLITEQVRQQQKQLNKADTMKSVNMDASGFLERIFMNAEAPFEEVDDASAPGGKRRQYKPHLLGPYTTNYVTGITQKGREGDVSVATPSVVFREPSDPKVFLESKDSARRSMLQECSQLHVEISGDATASGESRRQAMADYIVSLLDSAVATDRLGRALLETVWNLALVLSGQAGRDDDLRVVFECRINPGPVATQEAELVIKMVAERLLSRQTGMSRLGVEDVDAELEAVDNLPASERWQRLFEVMAQNGVESPTLLYEGLKALAAALGIELDEKTLQAVADDIQRGGEAREQEADLDREPVF